MKIDNRYEIRLVVIEDRDGEPGDCYACFPSFKKDHPDSQYSFGYIIHDNQTGFVAKDTKDWYDTPEDAMLDCCV